LESRERPDSLDELPEIANLEDFIAKKGGEKSQINDEVARSLGFVISKDEKTQKNENGENKENKENIKNKKAKRNLRSKDKKKAQKEEEEETEITEGKNVENDGKDEFGRDVEGNALEQLEKLEKIQQQKKQEQNKTNKSQNENEIENANDNEKNDEEDSKENRALVEKLLAQVEEKRRDKQVQALKSAADRRLESKKADEEELATGKHVYRPKKKLQSKPAVNSTGEKVKDKKKKKKKKQGGGLSFSFTEES